MAEPDAWEEELEVEDDVPVRCISWLMRASMYLSRDACLSAASIPSSTISGPRAIVTCSDV